MLARNLFWNLLGLTAPVALALFCIPPLIQGLGTPAFGLLTLVWVVLGYFSIFDLGIGRALTLAVSAQRATGSLSGLPSLIRGGLLLTLLLGTVGGGLLVSLSAPLARWMVGEDPALQHDAHQALWAVAMVLPLVTTTAALRGVLEAYERFDITNRIRLLMGFITYGGPLLVLQFASGLVPVVLFLCAGRALTWLLHGVCVRRLVPTLPGAIPLRLAQLRPLLITGGWMSVSNVVSPLLSYLDRFVVASIVGAGLIAYYTTPYEAVSRLTMVPEALLGVLFPALGAAMATDPFKAQQLYAQSFRILLAVMVPIATALLFFAEPLLAIWINPAFAHQSHQVMQWLTVGVAINCVARVTFTVIQSRQRADLTAKLHLLELPLFLMVLFAATHRWGIDGAAWAWCLRASLDFVALLWLQQRLLPTALKVGLSAILGIAALWCAAVALPQYVDSTWRGWSGLALTGLAAAWVWSLALQAEDRSLLLQFAAKLFARFHRR